MLNLDPFQQQLITCFFSDEQVHHVLTNYIQFTFILAGFLKFPLYPEEGYCDQLHQHVTNCIIHPLCKQNFVLVIPLFGLGTCNSHTKHTLTLYLLGQSILTFLY